MNEMLLGGEGPKVTWPSYRIIQGSVDVSLKNIKNNSISLVISSPPYNIGKSYEKDVNLTLDEYINWMDSIICKLKSKIKDNGSIAWQVGTYVKGGQVYPLDLYLHSIFEGHGFKLRNRIIWHYNFGLNSDKRFSGRYEILLWYSKTGSYKFNLDPVRIPQLYPGKRHSAKKGAKAGLPSGNPLGKNPSDFWQLNPGSFFKEELIWDIPNVKANHLEATQHPCQYPVELVERCVLALTDREDWILDPFVGTGTSVVAALRHGRNAIGIDKDQAYVQIARDRIKALKMGNLRVRPLGMPVRHPVLGESVATVPKEWRENYAINGGAHGAKGKEKSKEKEET